MSNMQDTVKGIRDDLYGPHDFVQTSPCGRGEIHPHGLVGRLWRIQDPQSVRVGNCFLRSRLKKDDLILCVDHSGDCFQTYIIVEECSNVLRGKREWSFGSYGKGDAVEVPITPPEFEALSQGGELRCDVANEVLESPRRCVVKE